MPYMEVLTCFRKSHINENGDNEQTDELFKFVNESSVDIRHQMWKRLR